MSINLLDKKFAAVYPVDSWCYKNYTKRSLAFGKLVMMKIVTQFQRLGWKVYIAPEGSILDVGLKVDIAVSRDGIKWIGLQVKPSTDNARRHYERYGKGITLHDKLNLGKQRYHCPEVVLINQDNQLVIMTKKGEYYNVGTELKEKLLEKFPWPAFIIQTHTRYKRRM